MSDETWTGKYWTDGSKIYGKVISLTGTNIPTAWASPKQLQTNVAAIVSCKSWYNISNSYWSEPFYHNSNDYLVQLVYLQSNTVSLRAEGTALSQCVEATIILEYTKST